jgi:hypothetical protein
MRYWLICFVVFSQAMSCSTDETAPAASVKDYFPLKIGVSHIYSVEETITQQISGESKSTYELRTIVTDSIPEPDGTFTYVIQRYRRADAQSSWTNLPTWSARVSKFQAIVSEENTGFLKVEAPIAEGKEWNGNLPNILDEDTYSLIEVAKPYSINSAKTFPNTITVLQNDNKDLIVFQDRRSEIYAGGVGLVYREILQLEYCTDPNCLGQQKVKKGIVYKQVLKEYDGL